MLPTPKQQELIDNLSPEAKRLFNDMVQYPDYRGQAASTEAKTELSSKGIIFVDWNVSDQTKDVCWFTPKGERLADKFRTIQKENKNLKRALRYLAVWDEPAIPEQDIGPARTLSWAGEDVESESRERLRKRRTRQDGVGRDKEIPNRLRRRKNTSTGTFNHSMKAISTISELKAAGWNVIKEDILWFPVVPSDFELTETQTFSKDHGFATRREAWDWVIDTVSRNLATKKEAQGTLENPPEEYFPNLVNFIKQNVIKWDRTFQEYVGMTDEGDVVSLGSNPGQVERYLQDYPTPADW